MFREKYVLAICIAALVTGMAGCGGGTSPTPTNPVSGLTKRVLITNSQNGAVQLLDGQNDKFNKALLTATPTRIVTSGGMTVVLSSGVASIAIIDDTKETVVANGVLPNPASDVAISSDGKTAYAAVRNSGVVDVFNTSNGSLVTTISVPSVTRLVMGPKGHKLLAFSDDPQNLATNPNSFFVIDTASNTLQTAVHDASFDGAQPYTAVFDPGDANDTTAFILFCGKECNGSASAGVSRVNFSGAPVVNPPSPVPVNGATVGLLSGSNLFVAGTAPPPAPPPAGCILAACGSLQVINTGTLTAGAAIPVTDGLHTQMALTSNNHLYIGASSCTPGAVSPSNQVRGCLSIFNTGAAVSSANPAFPVESSFRTDLNVTGLQPISGRTVIYVIQGGELDIFDFSSDRLTANQLDIVGHGVGVVQIDP